MALTPSTMLALGVKAPDFQLKDAVSGKTISLSSFAGKKGLWVMFICRHCPYVQHIKKELAQLGKDCAAGGLSGAASDSRSHADKDIGIVAVSANDASKYPDDAPEKLKEMALEEGFNFPFCYDETQSTAKAYQAACTPDFFLFDEGRTLVYRGQLDDSRPGNNKPLTGKDLRAAIEALLAGKEIAADQKASIGCNIKWKPGNEPGYAR